VDADAEGVLTLCFNPLRGNYGVGCSFETPLLRSESAQRGINVSYETGDETIEENRFIVA
jgi:hypothetical protein